MEVQERSNKVLLSGPLVNIQNSLTPRQLRDEAIKHIKTVYNYDVPKSDITNCRRLRGATKQKDRIILSFANDFSKNDLISKVIETDKSQGVNLSINEYIFHPIIPIYCINFEHFAKHTIILLPLAFRVMGEFSTKRKKILSRNLFRMPLKLTR